MSESNMTRVIHWWSKNKTTCVQTLFILLVVLYSLFLQHGRLNSTILINSHSILTLIGSLCVWFANKFVFEQIFQSKIEANKISKGLPFELLTASVIVTSIIYIVFYSLIVYMKEAEFSLTKFLQGFSGTIGLSLLIMMFYLGGQLWASWWSDGKFLFEKRYKKEVDSRLKNSITIKYSKGQAKFDLKDVRYFMSKSKIVFLVDKSGKKWMTQYNLSELEKILDDAFFRLNRRIMVSRQVISHIKKLPNHRLMVTINNSEEGHTETISRYKSTKFKHWYHAN